MKKYRITLTQEEREELLSNKGGTHKFQKSNSFVNTFKL